MRISIDSGARGRLLMLALAVFVLVGMPVAAAVGGGDSAAATDSKKDKGKKAKKVKFTVTAISEGTARFVVAGEPAVPGPPPADYGKGGDYHVVDHDLHSGAVGLENRGPKIGDGQVVCHYTSEGKTLCKISRQLKDGDIELQSSTSPPNDGTAAVVGGTGRYANATGTAEVEFVGHSVLVEKYRLRLHG